MRHAGPIGWLFKLLALIGRVVYYLIRLILWILRRLLGGRRGLMP